jgi:phage tail tape-measure protein
MKNIKVDFLLVFYQTTHVLTAAIHADTLGAGITAAAGTRLALQ